MSMERTQPSGTHRSKLTQTGSGGRKGRQNKSTGNYYHIEIRPRADFVAFRTQDVGRRGHIQRVGGQWSTGYWTTVKWLISKEDAHLQAGVLIPDTPAAKEVLDQLGSRPVHMLGDRFKARPQPTFYEPEQPVVAPKRKSQAKTKKPRVTRKSKK